MPGFSTAAVTDFNSAAGNSVTNIGAPTVASANVLTGYTVLLVVHLRVSSGSPPTFTPTINGVTTTTPVQLLRYADSLHSVEVWSATATANATGSVWWSATLSSTAARREMAIQSWSGFPASWSVSSSGTNATTTTSSTWSCGAVNGIANDLLYAAAILNGTDGTVTQNASATGTYEHGGSSNISWRILTGSVTGYDASYSGTQSRTVGAALHLVLRETGGGGTTYDESVSLTMAHGQSLTGGCTMQGSIGLTAGASIPDGASASLQAATTLAAIAAMTPTGTGTWPRAMSLSAATGLSPSGTGTWPRSMSLSAAAGLTPTVVASITASMALTGAAGLSPAATLIAQATALVSAASALATEGDVQTGPQTFSESIALSGQAALVTQTVHQMLAAVSMPVASTLTPTGSLQAGAVVAMGVQAAITHAATQMHQTAVALQGATGVTAGALMDFHTSIALSVASVLEAAGLVVGAPTYDVLRVAAESIRMSAVSGESLRQVGATTESLGTAGATNEDLV